MIRRTTIDKSEWNLGPWKDEPDYLAWVDDETGYRCLLKRNIIGAWCGFVGVPPRHPLYMTPPNDTAFQFVDVHGNVTFGGFMDEEGGAFSPPERTWWIGFDAMHDGDYCPNAHAVNAKDRPKHMRRLRGKTALLNQDYRDEEYMFNEVSFLAVELGMFEEPAPDIP
jgi:hypothetical protein